MSTLLADCLPTRRAQPAVPVPGDVRAGGRLRAAPQRPNVLRVPLRAGTIQMMIGHQCHDQKTNILT